MKLLTQELRKQLPPLGATANDPDPRVICRFFLADCGWSWYVLEFDGVDTFYGWVVGWFKEYGTFSLSELEQDRGPWGLRVERDRFFKPCRLSEVQRRHGGAFGPVLPGPPRQ